MHKPNKLECFNFTKITASVSSIQGKEVAYTMCSALSSSPHAQFSSALLKNVNNYLNTNIYSYLETSGGQSCNLYSNIVHFFKTSVN